MLVWTAKTENENADVTTNYVVAGIAGIAGAIIEAYAQDSKKSGGAWRRSTLS